MTKTTLTKQGNKRNIRTDIDGGIRLLDTARAADQFLLQFQLALLDSSLCLHLESFELQLSFLPTAVLTADELSAVLTDHLPLNQEMTPPRVVQVGAR